MTVPSSNLTPTLAAQAARSAALGSVQSPPSNGPAVASGWRFVTVTIAAGATNTINFAGDCLYVTSLMGLVSSTAALVLTATPDTGFGVPVSVENSETRWPVQFTRLQLANATATDITFTGWVGFGRFRNDNAGYLCPKAVTQTVIRPANVTPYAANQCVGSSPLSLDNAIRTGGRFGRIVRARLFKSSTTTANAAFRVWLWDPAAPPGPLNDQVAFPLIFTEGPTLQPFIDFPVFESAGAGSTGAVCDIDGIEIPFVLTRGFTTLNYGIMSQAAYVPASGESFRLDLAIEQL